MPASPGPSSGAGHRERPIVLCGPGNNGGDGFVIARLLAQAGAWDVRVALLGTVGDLKGDARVMAEAWSGQVIPLAPTVIHGQSLIVDALFGAGLSREVDGVAKATITAANDAGAGRVAVDIPSGIHGDTGTSRGINFKADLTVTFFRKKAGAFATPWPNGMRSYQSCRYRHSEFRFARHCAQAG